MTLGRFITRHRTAILGLSAMLVAAGGWAALTMPLAVFPEVAFHRITVIARSGNLPVEQTLTAVTQPLENLLAGVLGVEIIRSQTTRGGTQIDLTFGWKGDMLRSLQLVQAAMEEVRPSLPPDSRMEARLLDTSAFPIVGVAVTSRQRTLAELSDFVIYEAVPQLRTIPGVYRVELNGAKIREYALTVDPERLVAHRLELGTVERAVRDANVIIAGGQVRDGYHPVLTVVHARRRGAHRGGRARGLHPRCGQRHAGGSHRDISPADGERGRHLRRCTGPDRVARPCPPRLRVLGLLR